ncbi:MAG: NAD-dependent epimerase, partial [Mariniphaga sp.]|nr:NAD-dependent epimerase [Mariniphaga sp.]
DDIIKGLIRVIENPPKYEQTPYKIYNIGNSNPVKLQHFIEAIEKALNKKAEKVYLPIQPGDVLKTFADVSDLSEEMGYRPNTPITEGVINFVQWYKKFYDN